MTNFTKYNLDGLTDAQVSESRDRYGENVLTPPKKTSLWKLYLEKYNDPIIKILLLLAFKQILVICVFQLLRAFVRRPCQVFCDASVACPVFEHRLIIGLKCFSQ